MVLKAIVLAIFVASLAIWEAEGVKMTMEQMEQATGPVKMICLQKFQIDEAVANDVSAGKIPDTKEVKCYVNCIFEMMQMVRTFIQRSGELRGLFKAREASISCQ